MTAHLIADVLSLGLPLFCAGVVIALASIYSEAIGRQYDHMLAVERMHARDLHLVQADRLSWEQEQIMRQVTIMHTRAATWKQAQDAAYKEAIHLLKLASWRRAATVPRSQVVLTMPSHNVYVRGYHGSC